MYLTLFIVIIALVAVIIGQHCYHVSEMARMKSVATDALAAVHEYRNELKACKAPKHLRLVNDDRKALQ
ncbi:MAG: hypothetical protein WC891_08740 [Actinomycetota bacterium]